MLVTLCTNYKKKFKSCFKTLNEIGVELDKMIFVLNKSELLDEDYILEIVDKLGLREDKKVDSHFCSYREKCEGTQKINC